MTGFQLPRAGIRLNTEALDALPALQPPVADFSHAQTTGLSVQFTDLSVDPDGEVVEWEWDFGDTPTLPTASFTFSQNGLTVIFTDTSTDVPPGAITGWLWTFGDGQQSATQHPSHAYAASGTYNVTLRVTDNDGNQSVAQQTVVTVVGQGKALGPSALFVGAASIEPVGTSMLTFGIGGVSPNQVVDRLNFCRQRGLSCILSFPGGAASKFLTNGVFDPNIWKAEFDKFDTPAIRAAVADAVEDDILLGILGPDEPNNQKWGGYFHNQPNPKAAVDALATYAKGIFPTLPFGVTLSAEHWQAYNFAVVDFQRCQYSEPKGSITGYRDLALSVGAAGGHHIIFSINIVDAMLQIGGACPIPQTGGNGSVPTRCRITAALLESWSMTLGAATRRVMTYWRYDDNLFSRADIQAALTNVANFLATQPRASLRRGT